MSIQTADEVMILLQAWLKHWGYSDLNLEKSDDLSLLVADRLVSAGVAADRPLGVEDIRPVAARVVMSRTATDPVVGIILSISGFSTEAIDWVESMGIALFELGTICEPAPLNTAADRIRKMPSIRFAWEELAVKLAVESALMRTREADSVSWLIPFHPLETDEAGRGARFAKTANFARFHNRVIAHLDRRSSERIDWDDRTTVTESPIIEGEHVAERDTMRDDEAVDWFVALGKVVGVDPRDWPAGTLTFDPFKLLG